MIYAEFIDRDRAMAPEIFRQLARQGDSWAEGSQDRIVAQLIRTLPIGPGPACLCLWRIPGLERLDSWEDYFRSHAAFENRRSRAMHRAIHIARAGLYDEALSGPALIPSLHYLEFFAPPPGERAHGAAGLFEARRQAHPEATLNLVLHRLGRLAPAPGGIAIWSVRDHGALAALARSAADVPLNVTAAGVYRRLEEDVR